MGQAGMVNMTFGQEFFLSKSPPPDNMFCQSLSKRTLVYIEHSDDLYSADSTYTLLWQLH